MKNHIPAAINIYHKAANRMTNAKLSALLLKKCPTKMKSVKQMKKMPIIVYCYSKDCTAARDLIKRLYKAGYHNVLHYAGGITDWMKK
jgi:rhodanese-related sulfurtransferase